MIHAYSDSVIELLGQTYISGSIGINNGGCKAVGGGGSNIKGLRNCALTPPPPSKLARLVQRLNLSKAVENIAVLLAVQVTSLARSIIH